VIVSGFGATGGVDAAAIVSAADCVWTGEPLSLTVTVKLPEPPDLGNPEIVPVVESERPDGS
jgi:hypothetical protein